MTQFHKGSKKYHKQPKLTLVDRINVVVLNFGNLPLFLIFTLTMNEKNEKNEKNENAKPCAIIRTGIS